MIVWCDTETTSLDQREGHLLEVAFVVTDDKLVQRGHTSIVIRPEIDVAAIKMPLLVREMHEKNGLLVDVASIGVSLSAASEVLYEFLVQTFERIEDLRQIPLAGSTISFDRRWLRHHMPKVESLFSYRSIDVSCLTELAQRWAPAIYANRPRANKDKVHRALDDVRESINYLRYYRAANFIRDEHDFEESK